LDVLVDDSVIIEIKAIDLLLPVHTAQLLTYMRFAKKRVGLLLNFNAPSLRQGLKRFVM
jgi:GxxExxY protein